MDNIARVGIGVFVFKDGKFLMGQRSNSHGDGTWGVPGGYLEFGETFEDTVKRELMEETGLRVHNIRFGAVTNDYFSDEGKHHVSIWMMCDWLEGVEKIMEPDKFADMQWRDFDNLPDPLFLPWQQLLSSEFISRIKSELAASSGVNSGQM